MFIRGPEFSAENGHDPDSALETWWDPKNCFFTEGPFRIPYSVPFYQCCGSGFSLWFVSESDFSLDEDSDTLWATTAPLRVFGASGWASVAPSWASAAALGSYFNANPYPAFDLEANPDPVPAFFTLMRIRLPVAMRIRIRNEKK